MQCIVYVDYWKMYCQSTGTFSINISLFKGTVSLNLNDTNLKDGNVSPLESRTKNISVQ